MTGKWFVGAPLALALFVQPGRDFAPPAPPQVQGRDDDRRAAFFMGRLRYSQNNGNDCANVGKSLVRLVSAASTIAVGEERTIVLSEEGLFETPFVFMNGHYDFTWSDEELESLRAYLSRGGFLFASGCCTNPQFPVAWRREMARLFPGEEVRPLPYDHAIYRAYAPVDKIACLDKPKDIYLEGLHYEGGLVAVLCEDGLCCAFSMENDCNVGKGVAPADGKKLALNVAIHAMTH